jgi:transposase InsO family protein
MEDERLLSKIKEIHAANYSVYGARRMWKALQREGIRVGRGRVERLMRRAGVVGVRKTKKRFLTKADDRAQRPADLVDRNFAATRPNGLWLADLTYVRTFEGFVYVAFILDAYSRFIVGWQLATHLRTDLALDALEMAVWLRRLDGADLVHHSDRGSQYTSIRYTERLADVGITPSVGSVADAFDNAMAESVIGTFKEELIYRHVWPTREAVEFAVVEWINWYNHRRLHSSIGDVPPAEFEAPYALQTNIGRHPLENGAPESVLGLANDRRGIGVRAIERSEGDTCARSADGKFVSVVTSTRCTEEVRSDRLDHEAAELSHIGRPL